MEDDVPFTEDDLHDLYRWVDEIPISRPKRNIARDFADGCCVAEIIKFFFPRLVELHNYTPALSRAKKLDNWQTLNSRVLRKLYFEVPPEEVEDVVNAVPGAIERFLRALRTKIAHIKARKEELDAQQQSQAPTSTEEVMANKATPRTSAATQRAAHGVFADPNAARPASGRAPQNSPRMNAERPRSSVGRGRGGGAKAPTTTATTTGAAAAHDDDVARLLLEEKDRTIMELRETVGILSEKIIKLEELVRVKDEKLQQYRAKFGRV